MVKKKNKKKKLKPVLKAPIYFGRFLALFLRQVSDRKLAK